MSTWAKSPELFLYTKGNDVYLWRCNKTTRMPLITADFDDLGKVTDYLDLIGGKDSIFDWDKSSYFDLVAYISPRRLLVNSRGLVFAELGKFGQDGKMDENELPFYIRSLDVLSMKPFGLRDRTIPSRTVRYLEAEGKAAPVEDSTSTELDDGNRADLEKEVAELKAANKSLAEDVAAQKTVAEKAQQERDEAKRDKEAAERKAANLQTLMDQDIVEKKFWMSQFSDQLGHWTTFEGLKKEIFRVVVTKQRGFFNDDNVEPTTNVRGSYLYFVELADANNNPLNDLPRGTPGYYGYNAVRLDDLNPGKEKARFSIHKWYRGTYLGDMYAIRERFPGT